MSLTIKHPEPEFTGSHSGLSFVDGVAEIAALDEEARGPLLANGFTIDGEDEVPETPEEEAARLAQEAEEELQRQADADAALAAAEEKAKAEAAEAERIAAEKAEADKAAATKSAPKK